MSGMRKTIKKRAMAIQLVTLLGATSMSPVAASAGKYLGNEYDSETGKKATTIKATSKKVSGNKVKIKAKCSPKKKKCSRFKKVSAKLKQVEGEHNNYRGQARISGEKCDVDAGLFKDGMWMNWNCPKSGKRGGFSIPKKKKKTSKKKSSSRY